MLKISYVKYSHKGHVNGKGTREVYSYLKKELPSDDGTKVSFFT